MKKIFSVPDMSCEHCVKAITKALDDAKYSGFEVDLPAKEVRVEADSADKIISLLDEAGYDATLKA
ncbi:hypothetical protein AGMMS50276_06060 [Synergistales bacterium]|nr:hypothetical protein AGMMS50276_06060 [Synergistales bacterium]